MKYLKTFEKFNITSTTGNKVVYYFETGQGSKYLMTDKGETKRWKSEHLNTGGEDKGLKNWYQNSFFVDPEYEYEANSVQFLIDKGFKCALNKDKGKITIYIIDNGKWRVGNMTDAYPKSNINKPLIFDYIDQPKNSFHVGEYNLNPDNFSIQSYHFGSPVTKIIKEEDISEEELKPFKKS